VKAVVDANVWLAAFDAAEPDHFDSAAFLREAAVQGIAFMAPAIVPAEVAAATARRSRDSQKGEQAMTRLPQTPGLQFVELTIPRAEQAGRSASRHFLKGADSIYAALAFELGAELVTLDGELLTRTSGALTTLTPADWLVRHSAAQP
jgi:predicted nucleic acid-binding protein